jgi:tetratricopeptide (TPR) repeat protein
MNRILHITLLVFVAALSYGQSYQKKLALVIGNSAYQNGGTLKNPVNDARSMASSLQAMGFEVLRFENVTQTQMKQAINSFGVKLRDYEVGLFYYAGHGIQFKGANYMIPVEADLQAEEQIEFDCVSADRILAYMESASTKVNILIMDACRNNPFERSWHRSANGNGLAMMNAPTGTIIAYATAPGKVASDGESANGLYTSVLLKHMKDPDLNLEQVFKRVRTEVTEKSSGAQVPWETTSLTGDDFFLTTATPVSKATTLPSAKGTSDINIGEDPDKALQYYTQAQEKYDKYLFEEAISLYTKAIDANPNDYQSYLWRGHSHYSLGYQNGIIKNDRLEAAIIDYSKVLQLNPAEAEAYYYRASAKKLLNKLKESIPDFTMAIKYDPKRKEIYYFRGLTYYLLLNYVAAIEDFDKSIAQDPSHSGSYLFKAYSNFYLEDYSTAIAAFESTLSLDPNQAEGILYFGHCYYNTGDYQTALSKYQQVVAIDPTYAEAHYWGANAYLQLQQVELAVKELKKALAIEPANATYLELYNKIK